MKKLISLVLCLILISVAFTGCKSKEESYDFIYPFSADVKSYDPQVAGTNDEFLIIENTFEGLIRIDDNGKINPAVAEEWTISKDKKTYTFKLRKGVKWNIDTEKDETTGEFKDRRLQKMGKLFDPDVTANDFVFALQRAALKITEAPLFASIACIKNATNIHNGNMPVSKLGAKAIDDYTLEIKLSHPDDSFMQTLNSAIAMPCNEEFFNFTKGRYGLDTENTLFNGQFYVSQILESSYLLKANKFYTGALPTKAKELTLKITDGNTSNEETLERLKSGYYDSAFITGTEYAKIRGSKDTSFSPYTDTTWAFVFNTNDEIFQSQTMRKAFCQGFKRTESNEEYIKCATNIIPESCMIGSDNATKSIGPTVTYQDMDKSVENWLKAIDVLDVSNISVTVIAPQEMNDCVKDMLQGIQSGLGSSLKALNGDKITLDLKIEIMSEKEIRSAIRANEYDIAFLPFKSSGNSAVSYLESFANDRVLDFDGKNVQKKIKTAQEKESAKEIAKALREAEKEILSSYTICPMLYESSYYVSAKGVKNVQFHAGTGRVSFVNATRDE